MARPSPVLGSPVLGSPVLGSPVLGSPVLGSPVLGSPVLGSPVSGRPSSRQTAAVQSSSTLISRSSTGQVAAGCLASARSDLVRPFSLVLAAQSVSSCRRGPSRGRLAPCQSLARARSSSVSQSNQGGGAPTVVTVRRT